MNCLRMWVCIYKTATFSHNPGTDQGFRLGDENGQKKVIHWRGRCWHPLGPIPKLALQSNSKVFICLMKTPERSSPSHAVPCLSVFGTKSPSNSHFLYLTRFRHESADRQTDAHTHRHTDSADLSPTQTSIPYVLPAPV